MSSRLVRPARFSALAVVVLASMSAVSSTPDTGPVSDQADTPVVTPHRESRFAPVQPQSVETSTTLVAFADRNKKIRVDSPRGGRVWTASQLASHDVPEAAVTAYRNAAAILTRTDPACDLPWTLLAAIGRVESDHGRYAGSVLSTDGVSRPAIIGVALNGIGPVAAIHDTDNGRLDGDTTWDRAVGPMQFIPSTWAYSGRDGDGDGEQNPHDLDDTAVAAADYLCAGVSLEGDAAMDAAIFRYNPSDYYVDLVRAFEVGYRTGVFTVPSPDAPADKAKKGKKQGKKKADRDRDKSKAGDGDRKDRNADKGPGNKGGSTPRPDPDPTPSPKPKPKPSTKPGPKPSPGPAPGPTPGQSNPQPSPSGPQSDPSPSHDEPPAQNDPPPSNDPSPSNPDPSPSVPPVKNVSGLLAPCVTGWCLDGAALDLGPAARLGLPAANYDGDNSPPETLEEELTGLAASGPVTFEVKTGTDPAVVVKIAGLAYPQA